MNFKIFFLTIFLFINFNSKANEEYWNFDFSDLSDCQNWRISKACYGEIMWPDGTVYEGQIYVNTDKDLKHPFGKGYVKWSDGTMLQGNFIKDFEFGSFAELGKSYSIQYGKLDWPARLMFPNGEFYDESYDIATKNIRLRAPFILDKENGDHQKIKNKIAEFYPKKPTGKFYQTAINRKLPEKEYKGGGYDPNSTDASIDKNYNDAGSNKSRNIIVAENDSLNSIKSLFDDMGKFVDYGKSLGYEFADIDIYYDAKSIKSIGDKKRVWFIKSGLDSGTKYFKAYAELDCIDSITILDLTAFDSFSSANGSSVKTDGRKDYYEPESSFKNLAEEVCK